MARKNNLAGISCAELFELIPAELIRNLEQETKVNHQVKKLSGDLMLKTLLFSLLNSDKASLRIMENLCDSIPFKILTQKQNLKIKRTTIAERMANVNYIFFEKIFEALYAKFSPLLKNQKGQKDISRYDSTLVSLSAKLLSFGMKRDEERRMLKFTVGLKNSLPSDVKFFKEQSEISEELALKEAILGSKYTDKSIVVFDRGLQKRATFCEFTKKKIMFVTRLKSRLNFKEICVHKKVNGQRTKTLRLKKDLIIKLKDESGRWIKTEFRLIIAQAISDNTELTFLTNILDLNAKEITNLYKKRWDIEVFFKFLKQELNFKHWISRTENGIKVMFYATLILALLIIVFKERNKIAGYKIAKLKFAIELEAELIKEIIVRCGGDITKFFGSKNLYPG
jgi:hypothetical protein